MNELMNKKVRHEEEKKVPISKEKKIITICFVPNSQYNPTDIKSLANS